MRPLRTLVIGLALVLAAGRPAFADATAFIGADMTPSNHLVKGFAVGTSLLVLGFEFEFATASEDLPSNSPSLTTGMGNILFQTPGAIAGFQPYFTTGAGMYREELGTHSDTSVGANIGGGVKVSLAGPVRLRLDYRVFKLGSGALYSPAHRVYAGLNLAF